MGILRQLPKTPFLVITLFGIFIFPSENFNSSWAQEIDVFSQKEIPFGDNIPRSSVFSNMAKLPSLNQNKVDLRIIDIFNHKSPALRANQMGESFHDDKLAVYLYLKEGATLPDDIEVLARSENIIVSKVALNQIEKISQLDQISKITLPEWAQFYTHQTSQGVSFSGANDFHATGFDGTGVSIAVIDDSFFITDPEIASNIGAAILFDSGGICGGSITCGMTPGNSHGTAVAEIVVDMAPGVTLRVYAVGNSIDFNNAIADAILNNVDIITASLGFPTAGGTVGPFRDGTSSVAQQVNLANSNGILVTMAAGNQGLSHWMGTYSASPVTPASIGLPPFYQSVMNFQPSSAGKQRACLPVTDFGSSYIVAWNDWPFSNQDYDLLLYDPSMTGIISFSVDPQIGFQAPREVIGPGAPVGAACIVIASFSSSQNHFFHVNTEGNPVSPLLVNPLGSIDTPADASGAFAVGAIFYQNDMFEPFSSSGPTDDARNKPEICGPDGTQSHQSGLDPFFGTSAAAPHVAGAAALLLDKDPGLSLTQLKNKLISQARFNPSYSTDNLCASNSGALHLLICLPPLSGDWIIDESCILEATSTTAGDLIVQNDSVLTIPSGLSLNIPSGSNLLVVSGSGVLIQSGGTLSIG